jgi:hypothetical protein
LADEKKGWIGVDLDGTLAFYDGWKGEENIGYPISLMKGRVLDFIEKGLIVKIFTARAGSETGIVAVKKWLKTNGFPDLEVTDKKDYGMIRLYDDRAVHVEENTGIVKRG